MTHKFGFCVICKKKFIYRSLLDFRYLNNRFGCDVCYQCNKRGLGNFLEHFKTLAEYEVKKELLKFGQEINEKKQLKGDFFHVSSFLYRALITKEIQIIRRN